MKNVTIYTDGACKGNPGPGGWGSILMYKDKKKEIHGGESMTTNNRMELTAVIKALEILKEPCKVTIYSDSRYIVDAVNLKWAEKWKKNNWMRNKKEQAKNPELWDTLLSLLKVHDASFIWVKGHAENEYNNRCDVMAVEESNRY